MRLAIRTWVREYLARRLGVPRTKFGLEQLAGGGLSPGLIFDVGAYEGDIARLCQRLWPDASIACFEGLEHKVRELLELSSRSGRLNVFPFLLGAQTAEDVPLHEAESASSVLEEHASQHFPVTYHAMRTVDGVVAEYYGGRAPDLMKLDVQGYELEVLKGSEKSLPQMKAILAEINLIDIHQCVPLLADVVGWLNNRDWVTYDICALYRRPLDHALWQADLVFVPRSSPLRSDKRWSQAVPALTARL